MWLLFTSEARAAAAQKAIWEAIRPPFEVRGDGVPQEKMITRRWAIPVRAAEGWVIPAPEIKVEAAGGVEIEQPTFPPQEIP